MLTLGKFSTFVKTFKDASISDYENDFVRGKQGHITVLVNKEKTAISFVRLKNKDTGEYTSYTISEDEWEVNISYDNNPHIDTIYFMKEKDLKKFIITIQLDNRLNEMVN